MDVGALKISTIAPAGCVLLKDSRAATAASGEDWKVTVLATIQGSSIPRGVSPTATISLPGSEDGAIYKTSKFWKGLQERPYLGDPIHDFLVLRDLVNKFRSIYST